MKKNNIEKVADNLIAMDKLAEQRFIKAAAVKSSGITIRFNNQEFIHTPHTIAGPDLFAQVIVSDWLINQPVVYNLIASLISDLHDNPTLENFYNSTNNLIYSEQFKHLQLEKYLNFSPVTGILQLQWENFFIEVDLSQDLSRLYLMFYLICGMINSNMYFLQVVTNASTRYVRLFTFLLDISKANVTLREMNNEQKEQPEVESQP